MKRIRINDVNGNEHEITLKTLSYQVKNECLSRCMKTKMVGTAMESELDVFQLQSEVLKRCIEGVKIDQLSCEDGDRIFNEHYAAAFGLGQNQTVSGGNSE